MRVLFVTPYFPPEVGAAQTRIFELAVMLRRMGHEISILTTFPNYPSGVVPPEWRGNYFTHRTEHELDVYRVWSYATPNRGFAKRILAHLSFAVSASLGVLALPRCEAMIVESPPLFDGFIGVCASLFRSIPYLFTVSDLWPESAIQMGLLRNPVLIWLSKRIERLFYRRSAGVLAITVGIHDKLIAERIPNSKVFLFRNSVDCDLFRPGIAADSFRRNLGIGDRDFLAVYAGTFGLAQNLSTIIDAAALLQNEGNSDVRFLLAGDGAESDLLRAKAHELRLRNITFLAPLPKTRVPELLNAANCVLAPLRDLEIFRGALPTKIFEAMASGKPIVMGIAGEAAELLRNAGAGLSIIPESSSALRDALLMLRNDPEMAERMGESGRAYVIRYFSREARARELAEILEQIVPARLLKSTSFVPTGNNNA